MAKKTPSDDAAKLAERDARRYERGLGRVTPVGPQTRENYRKAREEEYRRKGK